MTTDTITIRYVAGICYEDSYNDGCVKYFDAEEEAKAYADSLDFYDASHGKRSTPSAFVRREFYNEDSEEWEFDECYSDSYRELIDTDEEAYLKWREEILDAIVKLPGVSLNARYCDGIYIDVGNGRTMRIKDHVGRQGYNWQCTYNAYIVRENENDLDPETPHFRPSSGMAILRYVKKVLKHARLRQ